MTVRELIGRFQQEFFTECDSIEALDYASDAHHQLIRSTNLRSSSSSVSVTINQREFALPVTVLRVFEAYWTNSASAGDYYPLNQITTEELDDQYPGWRQSTASGNPGYWYTTNIGGTPYIGLDQLAPSTTTGGYPILTVYTSDYGTNLNINDSLPPALLNNDFYLYYMAFQYCCRPTHGQATQAPGFKLMMDAALKTQVDHIQNLQINENPGFTFSWVSAGRFT